MLVKTCIALLSLGFLFGLCSLPAIAQNQTTGRITGSVKDKDGSLLVGARVEVVNKATGDRRSVVTDNEAGYTVPLLTPGLYRVRIGAVGFADAVFEPVRVAVTETTRVTAELAVAGPDAQSVLVQSQMQDDGPQRGRVVDSQGVSELPLATRNFTQILALSPGAAVSLPDNTALGRNSQNVSVNGARVTQNNFEINGIDANNLATNAASLIAVPAPETIQEFKVQTSLYAAVYGRGGGGNIQVITKSGGNGFHGAAWEYFRNASLNANNPFLKAADVGRPPLGRNVFGGMLGGPVSAGKIFFFISYQGTRERNGASPNSLTSNVFVAPGLTGDRSEHNLLTTFHPSVSPTSPPATSIHPVALALLNKRLPSGQFLIPTPQADGRFSGTAISTYREDQFNANIDYQVTGRDWVAGRFFFSNAPQFFALPASGANVPGFGADQIQNNRLLSLQHLRRINTHAINEARVGYSFIRGDTLGQIPLRDSEVGITRSNADAYPGLGIIRIGPDGTNAVAIGNAGTNVDTQNVQTSTTLTDIVSVVHDRHSIRAGANLIFYRNDLAANNNRRGTIVFRDFNNFLLGRAASSVYGDGIGARNLRAADYSLFVQDDWRVSGKLNLNLGLRYELDLAPFETSGAMSTFDPALYQPRMQVDTAGNPVGPPIGGFVQAGNVIPRYDLGEVPNVDKRILTNVDKNNIGPRFGFAFAPFDSGKIVSRGGYGIYFSRPSNAYIGISINAPPMYTIRRSPTGGVVPLSNPFFTLPPRDQFPIIVTGVDLTGQIFDRNMRTAYIQHFGGGVQYSLTKGLLFEVAYVGSRGVNLIRDVAINQAKLASPQKPIVNAVTGQVITTNTPANVAARAPYQGVAVGNFLQIQSTAQSSYNSLQISLTRRLSNGLQFLAAYTFGKSIDNASGGSDSTGETRDTINIAGDQSNNRANRGVSDFDRTHRFVLSYLWDLPRPGFADRSRAGKWIFSRWQLTGIITVMSGLPIDIFDGGAGSFYGLSGGNNGLMRPSWAPGATVETATHNVPAGYFFNPNAFVRPVVLQGRFIPSSNGTALAGATGTDFGTVGRNALRGPGQRNLDLSVIRRFAIGESRNIEFRAEFFDLFNTANFANPISNLSAVPAASIDPVTGQIVGDPGDFGRIISTSSNPRLIQFALKFNF